MDTLQKVQLKQSELKVKLSELLDTPVETRAETFADDLGALTSQVKSVELEVQAALLAQPEIVEKRAEEKPTETAEEKELRELRAEVNFGKYIAGALSGGGVRTGAENELNEHLGLAANEFPMDMLVEMETRAARDGDASAMQRPWVDRVFAESAAMRLGITFESVAPGVAAFPVTTAGGGGAQRGREQATAERTYTVAITELKPTRNAVHGIYTIEDNARLPGLSEAILRDMRMGIVEAVDRAIFKGDGGADENSADITGLRTAAGVSEVTLTPGRQGQGRQDARGVPGIRGRHLRH